MVLLMSGLETRVYRLPLAIGSRAQIVTSTVLGAPETFVERGVGRAFGRTGAFPAASIVLAQSAPLVRCFTRRHSPIFMTMFKCRRRPETTVVRPSTS